MERKTMTVMTGFEMNKSYFVPRTEIGLPFPMEECMNKILGTDFTRWKEEQVSDEGDDSDCGSSSSPACCHTWWRFWFKMEYI